MIEMVPSSRAKAKPAYRPESSKQSLHIWSTGKHTITKFSKTGVTLP